MKPTVNFESELTQYNLMGIDDNKSTSKEKGSKRRKSVRRSSIAMSKKRRMSKRHSVMRSSLTKSPDEDEFEKMRAAHL